jgi:hypothetical protein
MANVTIINGPQQPIQQARQPQTLWGLLGRIISILIPIAIIVAILFLLGLSYIIIDNLDYITTFFTTGVFGWLNPFDDPADDQDPLDYALEESGIKDGINTVRNVLRSIPILGRFVPDNLD